MADDFDQFAGMRMSAMGGSTGGGGPGIRLFGFLSDVTIPPILSLDANAPLAWLNKSFPVINMNPSNQNGLLSRILRALGFDNFLKSINVQMATRNQQEYDGAPIAPPIPAVGDGMER